MDCGCVCGCVCMCLRVCVVVCVHLHFLRAGPRFHKSSKQTLKVRDQCAFSPLSHFTDEESKAQRDEESHSRIGRMRQGTWYSSYNHLLGLRNRPWEVQREYPSHPVLRFEGLREAGPEGDWARSGQRRVRLSYHHHQELLPPTPPAAAAPHHHYHHLHHFHQHHHSQQQYHHQRQHGHRPGLCLQGCALLLPRHVVRVFPTLLWEPGCPAQASSRP